MPLFRPPVELHFAQIPQTSNLEPVRTWRWLRIGFLTWWDLPKRAWVLIFGQLAIILFLALSLVSEYLNNIYYRGYVNNILPILIPVLSVAFGVTSTTIAIKLFLDLQEIRTLQEEVDTEGRRRSQSKRPKRASAPTLQAVTIAPTAISEPESSLPTPAAKPAEGPAPAAEYKETGHPPDKAPQRTP